MGSDCFLCWFVNMEARDNVLIGGPWYVAGQIIGVERLPNLPLEYWDEANLARLARGIGEPLLMDEQTKLWNRCAFARICIRLDLSKRLPKEIWAHGLEGAFFQPIEYECIPLICLKCGRVGHKAELCKEMCIPPKQQGSKIGDSQKLGGTEAAGSGLKHEPACDGKGGVSNSVAVDADHGEWTIVTRRKRSVNNTRSKPQSVSSKQTNPSTKSVWREVNKM
ncbi:uncharacterized protein LOC110094304 [Dendrobium catenatum]|uniref:uncharacterized protein LOC110094304 n=1 Tax=Dendrobium catenatum TaxID=906689 RepID=UPI0009F42CFB|nr:uncharacterized protein LOC110094304 [Dendrobium catenatum]